MIFESLLRRSRLSLHTRQPRWRIPEGVRVETDGESNLLGSLAMLGRDGQQRLMEVTIFKSDNGPVKEVQSSFSRKGEMLLHARRE